jgi:uncharacterized repeat protein (TIGR01451 family)
MASRATWLAAAAGMLSAAAGPEPAPAQTAARLAGSLAVETALEALAPAETAGEPRMALAQPSAPATPGHEVIYTVAFANVGGRPIHETRISAAIPAGLGYIEGTAFAPGAKVLFSIDGGLRYAPPGELIVRDALGVERAARTADYTHVRWILAFPLEPGARGTARFRALVLDPV